MSNLYGQPTPPQGPARRSGVANVLLGVWDMSKTSPKSYKVKLEGDPKGWAYVPTKKVARGGGPVKLGPAGTDLVWCAIEVDPSWLIQARVEDLGFHTFSDAQDAYKNKTAPIVKAWTKDVATNAGKPQAELALDHCKNCDGRGSNMFNEPCTTCAGRGRVGVHIEKMPKRIGIW